MVRNFVGGYWLMLALFSLGKALQHDFTGQPHTTILLFIACSCSGVAALALVRSGK